MRMFIITLTILLLGLLCGLCLADEKSDCIISCGNDKHASEMYCPPAGGYTDEDHKKCEEKNNTDFNNCTKACSPNLPSPVPPSVDQPNLITPPPE